jgi:hypothetical protein
MCPSLAEPDSDGFSKSSVSNYEPQANKKFFAPAIFLKMLARCGRVAHICEANRNCTMKIKQKSKRESKESQLPFKIKRMQLRNKVSGAIAIP